MTGRRSGEGAGGAKTTPAPRYNEGAKENKSMYIVKYVENGVEKQSKAIDDRDEAFLFQTGLIAKRKRTADGKWDIETRGVWKV